MRYIKMYEDVIYYDLMNIYKKYLSKYFLLESHNIISMCKMLKIENNFINWEEYDYDYAEKGYQVITRSLHIRDFIIYYKILNSFDTFDEMKKEYNILLSVNKYNL